MFAASSSRKTISSLLMRDCSSSLFFQRPTSLGSTGAQFPKITIANSHVRRRDLSHRINAKPLDIVYPLLISETYRPRLQPYKIARDASYMFCGTSRRHQKRIRGPLMGCVACHCPHQLSKVYINTLLEAYT